MNFKLYLLLVLSLVSFCTAKRDEYEDEPGGEGEMEGALSDEGPVPDEGGTYLSGMMGSFYQRFEKLSDARRKKEFAPTIKEIDTNDDGNITYTELHKWALKVIEIEASHIDFSRLEILSSDTDKDGKLSWEEMDADLRKMQGETGKNGYLTLGKELRKEKVRFDYIDRNKDGYITPDEFARLVMPENFADMNEMAVDHYIMDYDTNSDGKVSKKEFIAVARKDPNVDDPELHFEIHDNNKDGVLDRDELKEHALDNIAAPHIARELQTIIRLLDTNKDGVLSYGELSKGHRYFTDSKESLPVDEVEDTRSSEGKIEL